MPWGAVLLFCFLLSWYSQALFGFDALIAPILKVWFLLKPFLLKTLPALILWLWINTGAKLIGWLGELAALLSALLGGWKAWSVKKMLRQVGRFFISLSARFVALSVLVNLLFGHERRGFRLLPHFAMHHLHTTPPGRALRWWSNATERQKRLILGIALCVILVLAGQALLGISVLLFDLVWELILLIWRLMIRLWRFLSPFIIKLIPNFIGNFFTRKILPLVANVVPIIKDDHRVIYLRFNLRRNLRRIKAWLYISSRSRRSSVRKRVSPLVSESLRAKKSALLSAAAKHRKAKVKNEIADPDRSLD